MNPRKKEKRKGIKQAGSKHRQGPANAKRERIISFGIFAFAFLLYSNTLNYGYVLDDDIVYLKNRLVQQGAAAIRDIFTHSFMYGFTGHNDQSYRPIVQL